MKLLYISGLIAQAVALQPGVTFFTDNDYSGTSWHKVAPPAACVRLHPSVLRQASSLHITGSCCRLFTSEDCSPGGAQGVTMRDVPNFKSYWAPAMNDAVVSYYCLKTRDNPYCSLPGKSDGMEGQGEELAPFIANELSAGDEDVKNSTLHLNKRVVDPNGRVQFAAIGYNQRKRVVSTLAITVTSTSAIYHALSTTEDVAKAVANNAALLVKQNLGYYPSVTYAYWSGAVTSPSETVYTIVVKWLWNRDGISFDSQLKALRAIADQYGLGSVARNFVPNTETAVVIAKGKRGVAARRCPGPRSAAGAGTNVDGTYVRYAATCDDPPTRFCLVQGTC